MRYFFSFKKKNNNSKQSQKKSQPKDRNPFDFDKKVDDYKKNLIEELQKMISLEKEKEEDRKLRYNKTEGEEEKKRIEAEINNDRNKAAELITKKNE